MEAWTRVDPSRSARSDGRVRTDRNAPYALDDENLRLRHHLIIIGCHLACQRSVVFKAIINCWSKKYRGHIHLILFSDFSGNCGLQLADFSLAVI